MGINIQATRKVSLKGFAEGWDTAYLLVRAVNEERRLEVGKVLEGVDISSIDNIEKLRGSAREVIINGRVISTDDEGKTRSTFFNAEDEQDLTEVINALNVYWLQEVLLVATGLSRLDQTSL